VIYNTDKQHNGFLDWYRVFFETYKLGGNLLEIGVHLGGSLEFARDLGIFQNIVGIDNNPNCNKPEGTIVRIVDQNDTEGLKALVEEFGGFDVVIDDGCHLPIPTRNCFTTLWPHTRWAYVIEDWSVAYMWPHECSDMAVLIGEIIRDMKQLGGREVCANYNANFTQAYIIR